jgi:hypothetical protein
MIERLQNVSHRPNAWVSTVHYVIRVDQNGSYIYLLTVHLGKKLASPFYSRKFV